MRTIASILLVASAASAFVLPDEQVFAQIPVENERSQHHGLWDRLPSFDQLTGRLKKPFKHVPETLPYDASPLDAALRKSKHESKHQCQKQSDVSPLDYTSWIEKALEQAGLPQHPHDEPHPPSPPHDGTPGHGPPGHHSPPWKKRPVKKHGKKHGRKHRKHPHHKRPSRWHPHHHRHHAPNKTIYELISQSNFTTNLTKLIDEDKDLVATLNSTKANYTLFAPTDWAFKRIQDHLPKVPKDVVKKVLLYHVLPGRYSSFRLIWGHTSPTLLEEEHLGGHPQRLLARWFGFIRGFRINHYSRVIAANIPATNGIIHATSAILLPPPPALAIITHLPTVFSTLELGLTRAGLIDALNSTDKDTVGGTLFAPTNTAFKRLGPRANAFLFSKYGEKYLKALLEYHVVPDRTLYSTAYYDGTKKSTHNFFPTKAGCPHQKDVDKKDAHTEAYVHLDLPTLLEKPVAVDIIRRGPFVVVKLNAFVRVAVQDALAKDGVIQILNSVLLPPKKPGAATEEEREYWSGEAEVSVDELKERLAPFVDEEKERQQIVNWEF